MSDEPRRHPWFLLLLALVVVGTAPFPFVGRETRLWLGIPLWLWWSGLMTLALAAITAWGIQRYWKDDDVD